MKEISGSLKINKTDKLLARMTKKIYRHKTQMTDTRNETGDIRTDPGDIKMIIRAYRQLYTHTFDNLDQNGPVL